MRLKFWGNSLSTLQLCGWLGRGLYPCRILAEISIKIRESSTVIDRAAYWVAPSNARLLSSKKKKREILHCIQEDQQLNKSKENKEKNVKERLVSKPTQNHEFLSKLNKLENKLGILRVVPGFANNFRPKSLDLSEQTLTNLHDTVRTTLPCDKLLELSQETCES